MPKAISLYSVMKDSFHPRKPVQNLSPKNRKAFATRQNHFPCSKWVSLTLHKKRGRADRQLKLSCLPAPSCHPPTCSLVLHCTLETKPGLETVWIKTPGLGETCNSSIRYMRAEDPKYTAYNWYRPFMLPAQSFKKCNAWNIESNCTGKQQDPALQRESSLRCRNGLKWIYAPSPAFLESNRHNPIITTHTEVSVQPPATRAIKYHILCKEKSKFYYLKWDSLKSVE